jgi:predicted nucleic acid-binding protein
MRVVLDTNIIVSALIAPAGKPAAVDAWLDGKFTLLTRLDGFLKSHDVYEDYTMEDFERDRDALKQLGF